MLGSTTITTAANAAINFNGNIAGAGTAALTKAGAGAMVLGNSANTYLGSTTINGGTLQIAADGSLGGNISNSININAGTLTLIRESPTNPRAPLFWARPPASFKSMG